MTTTNIRYVDPNAEVGGDGTTNALTGANCAYKSLAIWEAARQADLPSGDIIEKVICSSDDAGSTHLADTTACTIDGWTTDATRYIQIEAASSHGGKWDDTIYRMSKSTTANMLSIEADYAYVTGLQVDAAGGTGSSTGKVKVGGAGVIHLDRLIVRGNGCGIYANGNNGAKVYLRNSLVYDCNAGGVYGSYTNTGQDFVIENLTVVDCNVIGYLRNSAIIHCTNVGASGCGAWSGTPTSQTTCSTTTPTFVDADNDDFHLAAGDTTWKNQGTDLSDTFTDDIDGETRPTGAGTWDIGCDEYIAALTGKPYYYFAQL